jgi:hypothetical protein
VSNAIRSRERETQRNRQGQIPGSHRIEDEEEGENDHDDDDDTFSDFRKRVKIDPLVKLYALLLHIDSWYNIWVDEGIAQV